MPVAKIKGPKWKQNDNSHHAPKVQLRVDAILRLKKDRVRVLDAFAGEGLIWKSVQEQLPGVEFDILKIEKKPYAEPGVIAGDNRKVMPSLDLAEFDLIDLDAYGIPYEQLRLCAERAPGVPVAVTCIMSALTPMPVALLMAAQIPREWADKKRTGQILFSRWREEWWDNYCAVLGYTSTTRHIYRDQMLKNYQILW